MANSIAAFVTDPHLSESTIDVVENAFSQVFTICEDLGLGILFLGGDIFNSRKGQPQVVLCSWKRIIDEAQSRGIKIIAIPGNHDKTSYVSEESFLDAFDGHPSFSVIRDYGTVDLGDILIHLIPYFDEKLKYSEYLNRVTLSHVKPNVLITHVAIDGVHNNDGSLVSDEVQAEQLKDFDLVLVGHYHNRQMLTDKIIYTGSMYAANYGEDQNKGLVLIQDDCSIEYVMLDTPQFNTIELLTQDLNHEIVNTILNTREKDVNLRLRIAGELKEEQKAMIIALQDDGIKVELIKEDFKPTDVVQAEAVQLNSSDLFDLFEQWAKDNNISDAEWGKNLLKL